jgi:hypothetical protein
MKEDKEALGPVGFNGQSEDLVPVEQRHPLVGRVCKLGRTEGAAFGAEPYHRVLDVQGSTIELAPIDWRNDGWNRYLVELPNIWVWLGHVAKIEVQPEIEKTINNGGSTLSALKKFTPTG